MTRGGAKKIIFDGDTQGYGVFLVKEGVKNGFGYEQLHFQWRLLREAPLNNFSFLRSI